MKKTLCFLLVASLAACSSKKETKKLFVLSSGKFTVSSDQKTIKLDPSNSHTEQEIDYTDAGKVTVTVESPNGKTTIDLNDPGSYVLNLKNDTLTGGLVNYGNASRATAMSGEQFDKMVDSTRQLIEGRNVSDEKKTYFILPMAVKKISTSDVVRVVGPYKGIPYSIEEDKATGKVPEVYKFFTNKQQRESVEDLMKRMNK